MKVFFFFLSLKTSDSLLQSSPSTHCQSHMGDKICHSWPRHQLGILFLLLIFTLKRCFSSVACSSANHDRNKIFEMIRKVIGLLYFALEAHVLPPSLSAQDKKVVRIAVYFCVCYFFVWKSKEFSSVYFSWDLNFTIWD